MKGVSFDEGKVRGWLKGQISRTSSARDNSDLDVEGLADYVIMLLQRHEDKHTLRSSCTGELVDFLGDGTKSFVSDVFEYVCGEDSSRNNNSRQREEEDEDEEMESRRKRNRITGEDEDADDSAAHNGDRVALHRGDNEGGKNYEFERGTADSGGRGRGRGRGDAHAYDYGRGGRGRGGRGNYQQFGGYGNGYSGYAGYAQGGHLDYGSMGGRRGGFPYNQQQQQQQYSYDYGASAGTQFVWKSPTDPGQVLTTEHSQNTTGSDANVSIQQSSSRELETEPEGGPCDGDSSDLYGDIDGTADYEEEPEVVGGTSISNGDSTEKVNTTDKSPYNDSNEEISSEEIRTKRKELTELQSAQEKTLLKQIAEINGMLSKVKEKPGQEKIAIAMQSKLSTLQVKLSTLKSAMFGNSGSATSSSPHKAASASIEGNAYGGRGRGGRGRGGRGRGRGRGAVFRGGRGAGCTSYVRGAGRGGSASSALDLSFA